MGQRGHRKYRFRCQYVDPDTGLQCRVQVKRAGSKFCGRQHAWASMRGLPVRVQSLAAKARYLARRREVQARLEEGFGQAGFEGAGLTTAVTMTMTAVDESYRRGYSAGHETATQNAKRLKLETSKQVLGEFVASRAGKAFTGGHIGHDALADFRFGLER